MYAPRIILSAFSLAAGLIFGAASSVAHPHVWVSVKATVLFEGDTMTGLQQSWTFDEAYTAMAIEGLDTNGDGNYDRKELEELAKVNVDENPELAGKFGIRSIPSLLVFENGEVKDQLVGAMSKSALQAKLEPHLG